MPDANELLHSNLHEVFSERDPERRRAAIERTYAEDVTFIDPEREVARRQALNDRAQKLLDDAPADFSLKEDGPRYLGPDTAALAWRLGPPDGRGQLAVLTPAGFARLEQAYPIHLAGVRKHVMDHLAALDLPAFAEAMSGIAAAEMGPPIRRTTPA